MPSVHQKLKCPIQLKSLVVFWDLLCKWEIYHTKFFVSGLDCKVKGIGHLWVLQHCCLEAYCTLTRMSSFLHLQRRCTHQAA